ncbi:M14 family metallopeptidase [Thermaerobacter litoralis]
MKLEDLFSPGGLLVPGPGRRTGARRPRAQFLLSGEEDRWTGLAMVELAARLGYECEAGDPERLVVRPGQRPAPGAVPVVLEAGSGGAGPWGGPAGSPGPAPGRGRVEVVPGLAGADAGLRLSAADSRDLWKLAAWLAAVGTGPLAAAVAGAGDGTASPVEPAGGPGHAFPSGPTGRPVASPWQAAVRLDPAGHAAEVVLHGIEAEPWQPGAGRDPGGRCPGGQDGCPADELLPLEHLWTPRGLLGSSDGLHPDRVALSVEPDDAVRTWDPDELAGLIMFAFRLGLESTGIALPLTAAGAGHRPFLLKLAAGSGLSGDALPAGCGRIELRRQRAGVVLWITGDPAGRGRALQWLATAHASEALRPAGSRRPALDSPVVALERENARRRWEAVAREEPRILFEDAIAPEAERFRAVWHERALPAIRASCRPGDEIRVDLRLDQPDAVLEELAGEVRRSLADLGFAPEEVHVRWLPAFRQGFHWLLQVVPPAVAAHAGAHQVVVEFARLGPAAGNGRRRDGPPGSEGDGPGDGTPCLDLPIRWLQPLYPVDDVLAARTGLPAERIVFRAMEPTGDDGPTYRVMVADRDGRVLWQDSLRVAARRRRYQDANPQLGWVHVETGLCRVERAAGGDGGRCQVVFEQLLPTGAEIFWDRYQAQVLPALARVLEETLGPDLRAEGQPFFLTLEVDVRLDTRPDEPLGVRQESHSTAEGLHEDIYFNTLDFFEEWGKQRAGTPFVAPGKVVPRVRVQAGLGTQATVRLTGMGIGTRLAPADGGRGFPPGRSRPSVGSVTVDAAGRAVATLAGPWATRPAGDAAVDNDGAVARVPGALAAGTSPSAGAGGGSGDVPWQRTLFDAEAVQRWLAGSGRDSLRWSVAGHSFEGRPVYQVFPVEAEAAGTQEGAPVAAAAAGAAGAADGDLLVVPVNATLFRPTVLFKARHHANEVSSTNALLALLGEHLDATEGVNCVVMPLENVDGAALHRQLSGDNPRWSLHSARYNALGQEYASEYFHETPRAPETRVYTDLWTRWLPDVVIDEHGVPSHEWVQPFGAHGGGRKFTSYWLPRALIYGILPVLAAKEGDQRAAKQIEMAEFVARSLDGWPAIAQANRRWLAVYRKYAADWLPQVFNVETVGEFVCYRWPIGADAGGRYAMQRHPEITGVEFITEAADETAVGPYLETCAEAHLAVDLAILGWLRQQPVTIEEAVAVEGTTVYRRRRRRRPWEAEPAAARALPPQAAGGPEGEARR